MGELDFFMNDRMKVLQIIYQHQISVEGNSFCPLNQQEIADLVPCSKLKANQIIRELIDAGYIKMIRSRGRYIVTEKAENTLAEVQNMFINNLIYECDERYSQNKDSCQCEYCKRQICNESNCAECLRKIHYPEKDSEKRTYDCVNMADYYYCRYSYRYASEVVYGLRQFRDIMKLDTLKVMSVGCGPCTDLAAIDYLHQNRELNYKKLEFRGIDPLKNMWKYIWEDIDEYYQGQVKFYERDILELVDIIVEKKWIPDLIIFQYVFSDMYKKNSAEEIRRFIDKPAKFLNEQTGKSIYILANDANIGMKYEGGRDFFNILEKNINEPKIMRRYHFNNDYRPTHYDYGEEYEDNGIYFEIPAHIKEKYDSIDSCASA